MPEETTSSDNTEVSATAKLSAGLARGYTFQDVIAGACILSVFFDESNAVNVESKFDGSDKFDDIILEKDGEKVCLQLKNGPDHRLISSDFTGSNDRGLDFDDLSESAEARREAGEGSRFVVLTSFEEETGSGIEFSDEMEEISLFGSLEFGTRELNEFRGGDVDDVGIEFVLAAPGIGTTTDNEEIESLRNTSLFEQIVENVEPRLDARENPEINDPYSLTERAVGLARWARNQTDIQRLDRGKIIHRLELSPSKKLTQEIELPEGCIQPRWIQDLEEAYSKPNDRILVEGGPGSGKSVGIELFHRSLEDSEDYRTLRFYLYIPEDADSLEKKRSDPEWFRHQLAAQIYDTFPEAFEQDSSAPVWTGTENLQKYINKVAQWAEEKSQGVLFIIDGLDHALRQFGGTSATESAEGTVLEVIGLLDFPDPLGLLMVSREITESHDMLRVDNRIDVPQWSEEEIREYLDRKNIPLNHDFVEQVMEVSGGLPVIISHLIRRAEIEEGSVEEELQSAIDNASDVDGQLEEYYNTIWEPLEPYQHDAVSLVALNPTGLRRETINSVIDLPYIQNKTRLEEAPLAHVLEPATNNRFRVFHDSFRKFTVEQLSQEEIKKGHKRLYSHLFDQCVDFPQSLENLRYHAENGPGRNALKDLATLDNLLYWWRKGIHLDHLTNTFELAFDASLRDGDYVTAVDCIMLGGVARNMFDVYLEDNSRLKYYAAQNNRDRALRLVDQIQVYDAGSKEAIKAMQILTSNWEDLLDRDWLTEWKEEHQKAEQPSWDPEALFEVASVVVEPEEFWEIAEKIKREDTGRHFPQEVLAAVQKKPELFDCQPEPPGWLFEDIPLALEACEELIPNLPDLWCDMLKNHSPEYSELSLAALHTLVRCGEAKTDIQEILEEQELGDTLDNRNHDSIQFYDAYYVGSILAHLDQSPTELLETVEKITVDQPKMQKLLALMGAASTSASSDQREYWVNATLEFLGEIFDGAYLIDIKTRNESVSKYNRYCQAVSKVCGRFEEAAGEVSDELIDDVFGLWEETVSGDRCLHAVGRSVNRIWEEQHSEEVFPESFDRRYEEIMKRPPEEEPPSRDLLDVAIRAAREGYSSRGEKYAENAIEYCFRYGYRKDGFLGDVWKGLEDVADEDWDRHLGTAIQLVNWAGLLHELTDRKGTDHFEGKFLESLLDVDAVNYHLAEEHAKNNTTLRRLWNWRLENPEGLTEEELRSLIYVRETELRTRHSKIALPFFSKAAEVAEDYGWDKLVVKALQALNRGDYVRDEISSEREERLRTLASEHSVDIPDDLDSNNNSSDFEREEPEPEDNAIHEVLSRHSEEDPLSVEDLKDLNSEQLSTAGELVQNDTIDSVRYNPTAAAPLSKVLAEQGDEEEAIKLLENVIAERDLISSWLGGGRERFEVVAEALLDIDQERTLQSVLNGWRKSRLDTQGYQSILPQLLWIVKRTEGEMAAEELLSHVMDWTRRLMYPYEDWTQRWGVLESSDH